VGFLTMKIEDLQLGKIGNMTRVTAKVIWEDNDRPTKDVYFETSDVFGVGLSCNPHAFLVGCFLPAMHFSEKRIFIDAEICPSLEHGLVEVMNWMQHWFEFDREIVCIEARRKSYINKFNKARNAAVFLSGGVDSLGTLCHNHRQYPIEHPWYIRDAIFIQGNNIESDSRVETVDRAVEALSEMSRDAGVTLIPVATNIRELEPSTYFFTQWHGSILAAVAHALSERISTVFISATESIPSTLKLLKIKHFKAWGSHPLLDHKYSSSDLLVQHVDAELTRLDKLRMVADWDAGLQNIRVCHPNFPGENCCRCEKCIRTMLALIAIDRLDKTRAFLEDDLSESTVKSVHLERQRTKGDYSVEYDYLELIPPLLERGRDDLVRGIEHIIAMSRYQSPTIIERLKGFDQKYLGGKINAIKRFINRGNVKSQIRRSVSCLSNNLYLFSIRLGLGIFKNRKLIPYSLRQAAARTLGDLGFFVEDLFEKSVWRMSGSGIQIVFVGSKESSLDILSLFFDGLASHERIGGTFALGCSQKTIEWLDEGYDLVIYELSRICPFRPKTSIAFTVPQWVNQLITLPDQLKTLIAGDNYKVLRNEINKCRKAGYKWRFSQSRKDFDYFYHHLYLPFVRSRHGDHAHVAPYPFQWDFWIKKAGGGLVLIDRGEVTVAGTICVIADGVCYDIEMGVLDADSVILQQGINTYLSWCVMEWGKDRGARFYNMGGSFGWKSHGAFRWKARWKSHVIRRKYPYRTFNFAANRISPLLWERINTTGFLCESKDGFYSLILDKSDAPLTKIEFTEAINQTRQKGLRGVCVIAPDAKPIFHV